MAEAQPDFGSSAASEEDKRNREQLEKRLARTAAVSYAPITLGGTSTTTMIPGIRCIPAKHTF